MDISDLLASMQTDPGSRALARRTKMGAPTADGADPAADAAGGSTTAIPDQPTADTSQAQPQQSADASSQGVDMSQPQAPEQGAIPDTPAPIQGNADLMQGQSFSKGGTVQKFAGGGAADAAIMDLPEDYDSHNPNEQQNAEKYGVKNIGGPTKDKANLPGGEDYYGDGPDDPQGVKGRYNAQVDARTKGNTVISGTPGSGIKPDDGVTPNAAPPNWREDAHQAINAGIEYGHKKHAPNAPIEDGTGEQRVGAMMSGEGATPHHQLKALEAAANPDGTLDPSSGFLKAAQTANDFYSKQGPDGGAAAVWGLLQGKRKEFGHLAAVTTVNNEKGNLDNAAGAAEAALNAVPDGLLAKVTTADATGGGEAKASRMSDAAGASATAKRPGVLTKFSDDEPKQAAGGGNYNVDLQDPDSGKSIYSGSLTKEQINHLMAHGWDKMLHGGTQAAVEEAASTTENHNHMGGRDALAPATEPGQQDVAEINGIPRGTNIKNMSVGQVSNLRKASAAEKVAEQPKMDLDKQQQTGKERIARIGAGQNPDTGKREGNLTGRAAQSEAAHMRTIETDLQKWSDAQDKPPTPEQRAVMRRQLIQEHNKAYGTQIGQNQPDAEATPQAPQQGGTFKPGPGWMQNKKTGQYRDPQGKIYDKSGKPVNQ